MNIYSFGGTQGRGMTLTPAVFFLLKKRKNRIKKMKKKEL